jgi:hypothetical protein
MLFFYLKYVLKVVFLFMFVIFFFFNLVCFEPVTLTSRSGLTTHSVTDCPTPRGLVIVFNFFIFLNMF